MILNSNKELKKRDKVKKKSQKLFKKLSDTISI